VDIFSLYKEEKTIEYKEDSNSVKLILIKPTSGVKEKVFDAMSKAKDKAYGEITEDKLAMKMLDDIVNEYSKEGKIDFILSSEEAQYMQSSDLFPIGDRSIMSKEEIDVEEKKFVEEWKIKRRAQLNDLIDLELYAKVKSIIIDTRTMIIASKVYTKNMMLYCVLDENKKPLFKSVEDIGLLDEVIYNWLEREIDLFVTMLSQKQVRKAVQDKDFLSPTESAKSTINSTATVATS